MKGWSIIGLLFAAAIFATIPISPQVTPRGVELGVDHAQAITYGRYRRVTRRAYRRGAYGYGGYGYGAGYGAGGYGYGASYGYGGYGSGYGDGGYGDGAGYGYGYRRVWVGPNRWCTIRPSGFHWCWTQF